MEGVSYIVNSEDKKVAAVIDLDKHGDLWEDFLDIVNSELARHEETISLEDLKAELKQEGKL